MIKGWFTCSMCKRDFWDEIPPVDGADGTISFCKECGDKLFKK